MQILHVISGLDPRTGGPPVALEGLTQALACIDVDVTVVATWRRGDDLTLADRLKEQGIEVQLVGPCTDSLNRHPQLKPILAKAIDQTDIVHIHAIWEEIQHLASRLAHRRGVPYIIRPCGMLDPWSLSQKWLKKRIYIAWRLRKNLDRATAIHFTSDTERDLAAGLGFKAVPMVEPNGISLSEFESLPKTGIFRAKYPQIGERPLVLFLGRVHPKKGLDLLLPAFAKVSSTDAFLVIVGPVTEKSYVEKLKSMAKSQGMADRVIFSGTLYGPDRIPAFVDADLFVLPSFQENFGIAVIEALAAGTPVVISDQVNIHAQVTAAGVGGVTPNGVEPLTKELERWLTNDRLRQQAAQQARPFVWKNYDWHQIAKRWNTNYAEILNGR